MNEPGHVTALRAQYAAEGFDMCPVTRIRIRPGERQYHVVSKETLRVSTFSESVALRGLNTPMWGTIGFWVFPIAR